MKKLLMIKNVCLCIGMVSLLGGGSLRAAAVLTGPGPVCGTGANTAVLASTTVATVLGAGFFCEQQDKVYSNFAASASLPTSTNVNFTTATIAGQDFHTLELNGSFQNDFTFSYDIAIDPLIASASLRIVRVTGDILNSPGLGTPSNLKSVFSEGGTLLGTTTATIPTPGTPIIVSQTALHVTDAYTAGGSGANSVANTFVESAVPEPMTNALVGGGLLLLGWARRKRRA